MVSRLGHRGPDDEGVWFDTACGIALAHRRLSILDLSPDGHQPMGSEDGRYQLSFNGEIYNFKELRNELEGLGQRFRGRSDTEVLLGSLTCWGLDETLRRIDGMFALALWDARLQRLFLARDRFGKKPVYYGRVGSAWVFGSELKAFLEFPGFSPEVDSKALALFFRFGYVPGPFSIYRDIHKLEPASFLSIGRDMQAGPAVKYWSLPLPGEESEPSGLDELEKALQTAVARRCVADVPLGAFLSGGIDSSLIVALMQEQSAQPVRTFSIGSDEASHDEAPYAKKVAEFLGTHHTERILSAADVLQVVPLLSSIYDEPYADPSAIPTFLVSRLAREQVTVVLSGDGGDEVFGGYNRYLYAPYVWRVLKAIPVGLRLWLSRRLRQLPFGWLEALLRKHISYPREKLTKLCGLLSSQDQRDLYRRLTTQWSEEATFEVGGGAPVSLLEQLPWQGEFLKDMMVLDALTYLPDDILVKVDRATMAVGLEARAPLLDTAVAEVAWRLPLSEKISGFRGKIALRKLLRRRLPERLFERPKAGFSLPLGSWLRTRLRGWAEDHLAALKREGILKSKVIDRHWQEHLSGGMDWTHSLWTLLTFQCWTEQQREQRKVN